MKNLEFPVFPTHVQVTLIKSKLQIYPANPAILDRYFEIYHKVLIKFL